LLTRSSTVDPRGAVPSTGLLAGDGALVDVLAEDLAHRCGQAGLLDRRLRLGGRLAADVGHRQQLEPLGHHDLHRVALDDLLAGGRLGPRDGAGRGGVELLDDRRLEAGRADLLDACASVSPLTGGTARSRGPGRQHQRDPPALEHPAVRLGDLPHDRVLGDLAENSASSAKATEKPASFSAASASARGCSRTSGAAV
jgi:hypothetical protein